MTTKKKQGLTDLQPTSDDSISFIESFDVLNKKKKNIEETHSRQTYLIRNELIEEIEELAKKRDKGFKTAFINHAIKRLLMELNEGTSK